MMSVTIANLCFGKHDFVGAINALNTKRPDIQKLNFTDKDTAVETSLITIV